MTLSQAWQYYLEIISEFILEVFDNQSYPEPTPVVVTPVVDSKRKRRNSVDEMVKAALSVTDEAVATAEELLEKWKEAAIISVVQLPDFLEEQKTIERQYEVYKNRLFKFKGN